MDDRRDFDLSLEAGKIAEDELRELLTAWNEDPARVKIEVKRDEILHRTGNLFIEYNSRGMSSGIDSSRADWWAIAAAGHNDRIFILVERLWLKRRLEYLCRVGRGEMRRGGDNNTSWGYLVRLEDIFKE